MKSWAGHMYSNFANSRHSPRVPMEPCVPACAHGPVWVTHRPGLQPNSNSRGIRGHLISSGADQHRHVQLTSKQHRLVNRARQMLAGHQTTSMHHVLTSRDRPLSSKTTSHQQQQQQKSACPCVCVRIITSMCAVDVVACVRSHWAACKHAFPSGLASSLQQPRHQSTQRTSP